MKNISHRQRWKILVGFIIIAAATVWSATAALLSSRDIIPVHTELSSYKYSIFGMLIGCYYLFSGATRSKRIVRYGCAIASILGLLVGCATWWNSDRIFAYWKLHRPPEGFWRQAASDLTVLAQSRTGSERQPLQISANQLPKDFSVVGQLEEYTGGWAGVNVLGAEGVVTCVKYGNKERMWGLYVGPARGAHLEWKRGEHIVVFSNTFFCVGPNY